MAINFTNSPAVGNTVTSGNVVWTWNGTSWDAAAVSVEGSFYKLDDISASFDGVKTAFTLSKNSSNVIPAVPTNIIVSINGIVQEPTSSYSVNGSSIIFTEAPAADASFFGIHLGSTGSVNTLGVFNKLDDVSAGFNGSATAFTLSVSSSNIAPLSPQNLLISVNGVLQEPQVAYTVSGSTLNFTEAPSSGATFFGIQLGNVGEVASFADGSVTTAKLVDGSVTSAKLAITPGTSGNVLTSDGSAWTSQAPSVTTGKAIAMAIVFGG